MDGIDDKIINILMKNSRESFKDISQKVGRSEPIVRERILKLQAKGIIEKFTIKLKNDGMKVIVKVKSHTFFNSEIITHAYRVGPETILILNPKSLKELDEYLEECSSVSSVQVVLKTLKEDGIKND